MANRIFLFRDPDDEFKAFQFDATAVAADNWDPGFSTIGGAGASRSKIGLLDTSVSPAIVRIFDIDQTRQSTEDITANSTDTYVGIAFTNTHVVLANQTDDKLEYYNIATRTYDSSKDVTIALPATANLRGLCRRGNFLYVLRGGSQGSDKHLYKRNLDGSAASDWSLADLATHETIFATNQYVIGIHLNSGASDRNRFDGTAETGLQFGSGPWTGSYATIDPVSVSLSTSATLVSAGGTVTLTADFGSAVTGLTAANFSTSHGTLSALTTLSTTRYAIILTVPSMGSGTATVTLAEDAVPEGNAETTVAVAWASVPAQVTNLVVSGVTQTTAALSWDAPDDGGSAITDYEVSVDGGVWTSIGNTNTTHTVTGLTAGTTYAFSVRAVNAIGNGVASASVNGSTDAIVITAQWLDVPTVSVGDRFHARLRFNVPVTGFDRNDIRVRSGDSLVIDPSASQVTIVAEPNNTYLLIFNLTGAVTTTRQWDLRLRRNRVSFGSITGPELVLISSLFTIDPSITPTGTVTFDESVIDEGDTATATLAFNQPVSGVTLSDLSITGGTLGSTLTQVDSQTYRVDVTATGRSRSLVLSFAANGANEGNAAASGTLPFRTTPDAPTLTVDSVSQTSITLAITLGNDGGSAITDWEYSVDGGVWTSAGTTGSTIAITGLSSTTAYSIRVRGINSVGAGAASVTVRTNAVPTLSIVAPQLLLVNETGTLTATTGDADGDTVTVQWSATGGTIDDDTAEATTITAPATEATIDVTCVATDAHGATATATAEIRVIAENTPPSVSLTVPAQAALGATVNLVAMPSDPDMHDLTVQWTTTDGTLSSSSGEQVTLTLPNQMGLVAVQCTITDPFGATASETAYITVGDPQANVYTPVVQIEIEGTDVAPLRMQGSGISLSKSLDYPQLLVSKGNRFSFVLDNADGDFDFNTPDNFFVRHGLMPNGRGATVLVKVAADTTDPLTVVFAGFLVDVQSNLNNSSVIVEVNDMVSSVFQSQPETLGQTIRRRITDYAGANADYSDENLVFNFPVWANAIQRGSVRVIEPTGIQIVDAINTQGALVNKRAEIDYSRGLIRFEAPPDDGADTDLTVEWRIDYRYSRIDALVRRLAAAGGLGSKLDIMDSNVASYAVERAELQSVLPSFSSHGSPYFERAGVTRWMEWNDVNGKLYFVSDNHLVEYDDDSDSYTLITRVPDALIDGYETQVPYAFWTDDFDTFYFLTTNTARGDAIQDTPTTRNQIERYIRSTDTWSVLLHSTNGEPQLAHPYDFWANIQHYADNRKNFQGVSRNNKVFLFYRRVQANAASIAYYNVTDNTVVNVHSESYTSANQAGIPYSMDFVLDAQADGIYVYSFVVRYALSGSNFSSATLKVFRRRVEPQAAETEIFSETFTGTNGTDAYPISVSDIVLAKDRSKFYFVLEFASEALSQPGRAELCELAEDGTGTRRVLKTYPNPLLSPRSPCNCITNYFYFEGGWVRRSKTSTDADVPAEEHYYPNDGGTLIEILDSGVIANHGTAWQSGTLDDSPDATDMIYNGYGLHNGCVSNITEYDGSLHVVAGFGVPYQVETNRPTQSLNPAVASVENFNWIQWGKKLATKLPSYSTQDRRVWDMITELAQAIDYEVGFGPSQAAVAAGLSQHPSLTEFAANAALFFRPRTILPARLRTPIADAGTPTEILLDDASIAEFPSAPNSVIVDKEVFGYTTATPDGAGVRLSSISRGAHQSAMAAHLQDATVYFVDEFISSIYDNVLVTVTNRQLDYSNIKNIVRMRYGIHVREEQDRASIAENGGRALELPNILGSQNRIWAELMVDRYINQKNVRTLITYVDKFNPQLAISQLIVAHLHTRAKTDYQVFKVVRVTHNLTTWQTQAVVRSLGGIAPAAAVPVTIVPISGGGQSANVGQSLDNPLIVEVRDQNGDPIPGVSVFFQTTAGTLSAESGLTDGAGRASVDVTMPNTLGAVTITANVPGISEAATFIATATQAPLFAQSITIVSGNNQIGMPNAQLSHPFVVQVNDQNGNPLVGGTVTFSIITGNGSLSTTSATTDSNGRAQTTLTLGSGLGNNTVRASAAGLSSFVEFVAETLEVSSIIRVSGNSQEGLTNNAFSPFTVRVRDQNGNGLAGITVSWSITSGSGTLSVSTSVSNSNGDASTTLTAPSSSGTISVRASVSAGAQIVGFSVTAYTYAQRISPSGGWSFSRPPSNDFSATLFFGIADVGFSNNTFYIRINNNSRVYRFSVSGSYLGSTSSGPGSGRKVLAPVSLNSTSFYCWAGSSIDRFEVWDLASGTENTSQRVAISGGTLGTYGTTDGSTAYGLRSRSGEDDFYRASLSNGIETIDEDALPVNSLAAMAVTPNTLYMVELNTKITALNKSTGGEITSKSFNPGLSASRLRIRLMHYNKRLYVTEADVNSVTDTPKYHTFFIGE